MLTIKDIKKDNREFEKQLKKPTGKKGIIVAEFLHSHNDLQTQWTISLLEIKPSDEVLEIGFGTGGGIRQVAKKNVNGKTWGIDFSKVMLNISLESNEKGIKDGKVLLKLGDISNYDFGKTKFNKIFAVNVLYFWKNPLRILKRIYSLLLPKGKVVLFIYHKNSQRDRIKEGILKNYSGEEVVCLLKKAGFNKAFFKEKKFSANTRLGVCIVGEK
jgi:ubiquinone/menaquinone biosynthesis C-methylase UbiE